MKIVNPPRVVEADPPPEHKVTHHEFEGGWHGVTFKATQVSVAPDASITLPSHVRPEDVEDFVVALRAAAPVAAELKAKASNPVQADPRRVFSERLQARPAGQTTPALPAREAKPAFTAERLARARTVREMGGAES